MEAVSIPAPLLALELADALVELGFGYCLMEEHVSGTSVRIFKVYIIIISLSPIDIMPKRLQYSIILFSVQ